MEIRTRRGEPDPEAPRPGPLLPAPGTAALSNRGVAGLLGIHREEGWAGQPAGSKNRGGPIEFRAPGGGVVRRHALRGIQAAGMLTDQAIAIVPDGLPRDGTPVDVLVHLHGFQIAGYGAGYEDARPAGGQPPIDVGAMKLEQQMAASGRPVVGVLPQGSATSDFSAGAGKGFDLPGYVKAVFDRLTADGGWGAAPAGTAAPVPPVPGRTMLSGHSGADQPISEMLKSGASGEIGGLFLFDTMIVGSKENAARPRSGQAAADWRPLFEGRVEAYVIRRMDADLGRLQALKGGPDPAAAAAAMRDYVAQHGFRLSVVYRRGGAYDQAAVLLKGAVDGWFAKLDPTAVGADVAALLRANYQVRDVPPSVEHMDVMASGDGMRRAMEMMPLSAAAPGSAPAQAPGPAPGPSGPAVNRAMVALAPATGNHAVARALAGGGRRMLQRDDEPAPAVDPAAEFAGFARPGAVEGGLAGYRDIRDVFIATFGTIAKANAYYRGVKQVPFLGLNPYAHEATLGARLAAAEALLKQKQDTEKDPAWYDDLKTQLRVAGGFNIRRNRNNPSVLSDHSFGWAVDLNETENPNLHGRFPGRALMAATGESIAAGAMGTVAAGGTTQELLAPVEEIRAASQAFEDAFRDETSLGQAMRDYVVTRLKFTIPPDLPLLDMVKAAAGRGKAGTKARTDLSDRLKEHWTSIPDAEAFLDEADREQIVANQGWDAWKAEKAKRDRERTRAEEASRAERGAAAKKAERMRAAGKSAEEIRTQVDDPLMAARVARFEAELRSLTDRASGTLVEMWNIYVSSFERGKTGGARVGAQSEGTPGTVAAHGFMNMPSRLAAALCGSDGGALDWLGAGLARDFMHFQLTPSQRPPLR